MNCAICGTRRPRRFCPGVRGDICSVCCGTEREVTVECPLDCEYLRQARRHEPPRPVDPEELPHKDIAVTEKLVDDNAGLLTAMGRAIAAQALRIPGVVDVDVRESLEALIRTARTLASGVYYETVPTNPLAAAIYRAVQEAAQDFRKQESERLGISKTRESDVLAALVFLDRLAFSYDNGRRRGRAFIGALAEGYGAGPPPASIGGSSLILA